GSLPVVGRRRPRAVAWSRTIAPSCARCWVLLGTMCVKPELGDQRRRQGCRDSFRSQFERVCQLLSFLKSRLIVAAYEIVSLNVYSLKEFLTERAEISGDALKTERLFSLVSFNVEGT